MAKKSPHQEVCKILEEHHRDTRGDPEHLPTEFIISLIAVEEAEDHQIKQKVPKSREAEEAGKEYIFRKGSEKTLTSSLKQERGKENLIIN